MCRSDVLTAQVAKATNTRHMSFWLKVNEVRGPRGFSRKEKHVLSSSISTKTRLPCTRLSGDTSVWGHVFPAHVCLGHVYPTHICLGHECPGTHFLSHIFPVMPLSQDTGQRVAQLSQVNVGEWPLGHRFLVSAGASRGNVR